MPLKTIEARREYLRNWRAKKRLEKAAAAILEPPYRPTSPPSPPDNIAEIQGEPCDENSEISSETQDSECDESDESDEIIVEAIAERQTPATKEQPGLFSKLMMAFVLSIAMPAIGLIVERFGGNATEIKKRTRIFPCSQLSH